MPNKRGVRVFPKAMERACFMDMVPYSIIGAASPSTRREIVAHDNVFDTGEGSINFIPRQRIHQKQCLNHIHKIYN